MTEFLTESELEHAMAENFRIGDFPACAHALWQLKNESSGHSWRIYLKKLLRAPELQGAKSELFKEQYENLKKKEGSEQQIANILSLGLLLLPKDRFLAFAMATLASKLKKPEWVEYALAPLGEPTENDVELMNAHAALSVERGDYSRALKLFERLYAQTQGNIEIGKNVATALVGLNRHDEARDLLEKLLVDDLKPLDTLTRLLNIEKRTGENVGAYLLNLEEKYLSSDGVSKNIEASVAIDIYLQRYQSAAEKLSQKTLETKDPEQIFRLSELQLVTGDYLNALRNYSIRFTAFPELLLYETTAKPYQGEFLEEESLFVWMDQGIGEELIFSYFLDEVAKRVRSVTVCCDGRLKNAFERKFESITFLNRYENRQPPETDYACSGGDLFTLFLPEVLSGDIKLRYPGIWPSTTATVQNEDSEMPAQTTIAISWRGGRGVSGRIRSLSLEKLLKPSEGLENVRFISLQYDDKEEQDIESLGDERVLLSGIDNKNDLEGVMEVIGKCDAVLSIDNSVAHLGSMLCKPTAVVIPSGQTQWRWKNAHIRECLLPYTNTFIQQDPEKWDGAVAGAWEFLKRKFDLC